MDIKKLIKLQNAIIRAHQKINDVQNSSNNQTEEIKNEFKKEIANLTKTLEQLNKELNTYTKKEEIDKQNIELEGLKLTLDELNKSIDRKISSIQLKHGKDGINGKDGKDGRDGNDGKPGKDGKSGRDGKDGCNGLSAYEIAVKQGYEGTEKEWIDHITNNGGKNYSGQIAAIRGKLNELEGKITPEEDVLTTVGGDNIAIEDNTINVYTNTGYAISDKDVKYQNITSTGSVKKQKIIYVDEVSLTFITDGSNKLRISKNNIDFEAREFTRELNDIIFVPYNKALVILSSKDGVLLVSSDYGETWNEHSNAEWVGYDYLFTFKANAPNFNMVRKSEREIRNYRLMDDFSISDNGYLRTDFNDFMARFNNNYFISCDENGQFGYCNESFYYDKFADLPAGYIVNNVVSHESTPIVCLKNSNKIFMLRYTGNTSTSNWLEYTLPQVCTVNDVIYYPNTKEYYILTDTYSYFKTKDFVNYETIDNGVIGLQGCVTLMGIQATTNDNGKLMLAPARTRLEDKAQEWDKATQKERWVGEGLRLNSNTGVVSVRLMPPLTFNSTTGAIRLQELSMDYMAPEVVKAVMLAEAPIHTSIMADYGDMDAWFWEEGYPLDGYSCINKIIFDEATTFWDFASYETEYTVEQYEYGYIYYDETDDYICEYVKLGNLGYLFNKGE